MKKTIFKISLCAVVAVTPMLAFAQQGKTLRDVIVTIISYFSVLMTLIIGLAVLTFVWNVYNYFFKADVENKKEAGLYVMYSVIGFFVILSIWGLVNILTSSLKLDNKPPQWPFGIGSQPSTLWGVTNPGNPNTNNTYWSITNPGTFNPSNNPDPSSASGQFDVPADPDL